MACSRSGDPTEDLAEEHVPAQLRIFSPTVTKIIAHRGYWNKNKAAENSLAALDNAIEAGLYGSEFDVRMTSDGVIVINHDSEISGMTIERTPYARLQNVKLLNGEKLPTLRDYLSYAKGKNIKMICELKAHEMPSNNIRLTDSVVAIVNELEVQEQIEYISFVTQICQRIKELSPDAHILLLSTAKFEPAILQKMGLSGVSYYFEEMKNHSAWITEAHDSTLQIGVWVVNNLQWMHTFVNQDVDYITTDKPGTLKEMLGIQ
ncbi:MAG: glycerophosphodiester phosphodiesterase [Tannerella sp.]|nr:glycerophosphodiester phosphodiesterase [Tannerella sp.]